MLEKIIDEIMNLDEEQADILFNLLAEQVFNKRDNKDYSKLSSL